MKILRTIEDRGQEPLLPQERVKEASLSATKRTTFGCPFFVADASRVLTFFQSLRFVKAPLRAERESLSLRNKGQRLVVLFLLRMRAGFSGSADLRLSGSHVLSEISDYSSSLIFTTLLSSKPTVGFFAKGQSECGISNR